MPQSTGAQTILQQNERGIHVTPVYHSIRVLNPFFKKKSTQKKTCNIETTALQAFSSYTGAGGKHKAGSENENCDEC